jgi:acyl-CoA thioesterase
VTVTAWPVGGLTDELVAEPELCSGDGWFFGGWGLGLLVEAARGDGGGFVTDLAAGFFRPVRVGSRLSVRQAVGAAGRTLRHSRVDAYVEGQLVLGGTAVVGPRPGPAATAALPPRVPPPQDCPERRYLLGPGPGVRALLDVRVAGECLGAGEASWVRLWVRTRVPVADEVRVAVASDHIPYLMRRMEPTLVRASTVSASLRLFDGDVDEWVLVDIRLVARGERSAVGRARLWSGGTRLVGVAEQTTHLRR